MVQKFKLPERQAEGVATVIDSMDEGLTKWGLERGEMLSRVAGVGSGKSKGDVLNQADAPTFYSQLRKVVDEKMPARMKPAELARMVSDPQKGVKADELKWTGLDDYLREKAGRNEAVTKDEVQKFLAENEVRVEEVVKGDKGPVSLSQAELMLKTGKPVVWRFNGPDVNEVTLTDAKSMSPESAYRQDVEAGIATLHRAGSEPKFSQYTLPGAKEGTYRELLLTLPEIKKEETLLPSKSPVEVRSVGGREQEFYLVDRRGEWGTVPYPTREAAERALAEQRGAPQRITVPDEQKNYYSSHYDEPNILAHVRFNERVDAEGKRVLFVEEIQSDWHQAGRKKGYNQPPMRGEVKPQEGGLWKIEWADDTFSGGYGSEQAARSALAERAPLKSGSVPDAPFKKNWHELAMKRILRHASENGYDRVAWTTGEQQAARYDLSKQVERIEIRRGTDGLYEVRAFQHNASNPALNETGLPLGRVEEFVGKDLAKKAEGQRTGFVGRYEGVDLKVGGEGMKGFYDKILPSFVSKYAKKWPGAKVGETEISSRDPHTARYAGVQDGRVYRVMDLHTQNVLEQGYPSYERAAAAAEKLSDAAGLLRAHSIDITPEMRRSVTQEGQPLFQNERAATKFLKDGRAVIHALDSPNVSSGAHEVHHVFAPVLAEATLKTPDATLKQTGEAFFKWMGFKDAKEFSELHEGWVSGTLKGDAKARYVTGQERGARGFERYLKTGEAPSVQLRQVFSDFKQWLTDIYGKITTKGHPLAGKLSPEAIKAWDTVLGAPKGEHGQLIHQLHKAPSEGTPAFFENAQVKRALGLKPDATTADVRARLTEQIGKRRSSHLSPEDVSKWADSKGLQGAAREALDFATEQYKVKAGKDTVGETDAAPEPLAAADLDPVEQYTATLSDAERKSLQPFDRMLEDERAGKLIDSLYDPATDLKAVESRLRSTAARFGVSTEHLDAIVADARKGREPDYRTPKLAPVSSLNLDPARFQYKLNPGRGGQTGSLADVGKWNTDLEGVVQIWRDPANGKDYVVNGHNRVAKAKDLGVTELPVRYVKAENAKEARAIGALVNIGEGNGTALDAAKFFKDAGLTPEDLKAAGVPLQKKVATEGLALSRLSEPVFSAVVSKTLPQDYGVAIGERTVDETLQTQALAAIRKAESKGRRLDRAVVAEMMDAVTAAPRQIETEQTLFGSFTNERSLYAERAQAAASLKRLMSQDKTLFGTAARRAERLGEGGTRVDVTAARELSETAGEALEVFDQLKNRSGAISDILDQSAKRIAGGQRPDAAAKEAYEGVKEAVRDTLGRGARGGQTSVGDAGSQPRGREVGAREEVVAGETRLAPDQGDADSVDLLYQSGGPQQLGFVQEGLTQQDARPGQTKPKPDDARTDAAKKALGAESYARLTSLKDSPVARMAVEVERRVNTANSQNAPDVVAALSKLAELKRQKQTVDDYLNQGSLFGDRELTPAQERILSALDRNPRKVIDEAFPAEKQAEQNLLFQSGETGKVTETPEFKRWFGGSKIVDESGAPLVVHHGTDNSFDVFDPQGAGGKDYRDSGFFGKGFYFSEDAGEAAQYGKNVVSAHVRVHRPLDLRSDELAESAQAADIFTRAMAVPEVRALRPDLAAKLDDFNRRARVSELGEGGFVAEYDGWQAKGDTPEAAKKSVMRKALELPEASKLPMRLFGADEFTGALKRAGYDGVRAENEIVAFEPTQIKSVKNRGTFDPSDPNILYQSGDTTARRQRAYRALLEAKGQGSLSPELKTEKRKATFGEKLADVANAPRSLKSSIDLSAAMRQGAMFTLTHPFRSSRIFFGQQLRSLSNKGYEDFVTTLKADPDLKAMRDSGLHLTSLSDETIGNREEAFASKLAGKVPLVKRSEHAYVTFLDAARSQWFKQLKRQADDAAKVSGKPVTKEQYQAIAKFVNRATGRGDLGKGAINDAAPLLNSIFFAPRYAVSKVQVFDPRTYSRLPSGARKMAVRQAVQYFGTIAATALLLKYGMGADVGTDPEESNFLKVKVGNTRYDLAAGSGQYVTLAARLGRNLANRANGTKDEQFKGLEDNVTRFLRYKLAPVPAAALNAYQKRDAVGQKTDVPKEALGLVTPIYLTDLYEAFQQEGGMGLAKTAPGFVGIGVQTYQERPKSGGVSTISVPPPPPKKGARKGAGAY